MEERAKKIIEANILKLKERLGKDVEECRPAEEQNV